MVKASLIILSGFAVVILGIMLIFIGTILQSTSKTEGVSAGGVVLIGPIPIIFGTDKSFLLIGVILAIILMIVSYLLFYRIGT